MYPLYQNPSKSRSGKSWYYLNLFISSVYLFYYFQDMIANKKFFSDVK